MKKFALSLMVLALAACGSDGGSSGSDSGPGTDTGTPAPVEKDEFGNCYGTAGQECTGIDEYTTCVLGACDAEYQDCFGADYMNGNWGGKCGDYIVCNIDCDCGDTACNTACLTNSTQDCQDCLQSIATCVLGSGCNYPVCKDPNNQGGANCDALQVCCDKLMDAMKPACQQAVDLGDDNVCKQNLDSWTMGGLC